ncbi:MAG: alpha/beta hydrolase [Betaproteobacteria bacterium]|nr:alpha/beta hydrolase [Betaproteobacteria bacterium]
MSTEYDLQYNPRLTVNNVPALLADWTASSAAARASTDCTLDVSYGEAPTEMLDIFRTAGKSMAVMIFIHGGYWRSLDKRDFSFIAPTFTRAGVTVVVPNYALCPAVTVEHIVKQMLQATAWTYRHRADYGAAKNPIYVVGHSAGGHLTAMMLAAAWDVYAADLPPSVVSAGLSVSGVYDLTAIVRTPSINNDVRLTDVDAIKASPISYAPSSAVRLYTAVGELENEGFHIQNGLIGDRWHAIHEIDVQCEGANHFTVLDQLIDPTAKLHQTALKMMEIT